MEREEKMGGGWPGRRAAHRIVWRNVVLMSLLHLGAVYSLSLVPYAQPLTWLWAYICFLLTALGVTAGAHRLWSHRSYKAKLPLRMFLAAANSMAFQNDIYEWSRDHRVHHKYSESNADPHNATRGFFFSHIGWLFVRKHPDVAEKGKKLDVSDLLADPVVVFQRKYYRTSVLIMCFLMPTIIPWYFWGESLWNSYFLASILRYTISLNVTWLVNSAAHMYGNRPYDKNISPRENRFVTFGALDCNGGCPVLQHGIILDLFVFLSKPCGVSGGNLAVSLQGGVVSSTWWKACQKPILFDWDHSPRSPGKDSTTITIHFHLTTQQVSLDFG
ncbi:stearoyl-CoA desaturase 5-like isoform X1 [Mobula hypostoma]|uniref:stearoyl-CoA desaturase 5-like isoform X1 n=1 Tax=Mobula hypostoma TaxID=723540 RepID=UPI002FC3D459